MGGGGGAVGKGVLERFFDDHYFAPGNLHL
jgi:hypothetical protein